MEGYSCSPCNCFWRCRSLLYQNSKIVRIKGYIFHTLRAVSYLLLVYDHNGDNLFVSNTNLDSSTCTHARCTHWFCVCARTRLVSTQSKKLMLCTCVCAVPVIYLDSMHFVIMQSFLLKLIMKAWIAVFPTLREEGKAWYFFFFSINFLENDLAFLYSWILFLGKLPLLYIKVYRKHAEKCSEWYSFNSFFFCLKIILTFLFGGLIIQFNSCLLNLSPEYLYCSDNLLQRVQHLKKKFYFNFQDYVDLIMWKVSLFCHYCWQPFISHVT